MESAEDPASSNPADDTEPLNATNQQFAVQYNNKQLPESVTWNEPRPYCPNVPLIRDVDFDGSGAFSPRSLGIHSGWERFSCQQTLPTLNETTGNPRCCIVVSRKIALSQNNELTIISNFTLVLRLSLYYLG